MICLSCARATGPPTSSCVGSNIPSTPYCISTRWPLLQATDSTTVQCVSLLILAPGRYEACVFEVATTGYHWPERLGVNGRGYASCLSLCETLRPFPRLPPRPDLRMCRPFQPSNHGTLPQPQLPRHSSFLLTHTSPTPSLAPHHPFLSHLCHAPPHIISTFSQPGLVSSLPASLASPCLCRLHLSCSGSRGSPWVALERHQSILEG